MFFKNRKKKKQHQEAAVDETVMFEDAPLQTPPDLQAQIDAAQKAKEAAEHEGEVEEVELDDQLYEIEFDEDDVQYYLVDEDDNELGFVLLDEDGNEVEYFYAEEEIEEDLHETEQPHKQPAYKDKSKGLAYRAGAAAATAAVKGKAAANTGAQKAKEGVEKARGWADKFQPDEDGEYDLGITREGVKETTQDMNVLYHEGVETITELRDAFDDIKEGLNLDGLLGKNRRRR